MMRDISDSLLSDKHYSWLCLRLIKGVGNSTFLSLLDELGSPEEVFKTDLRELVSLGLKKEVAKNIVQKNFLCDPEAEIKKIKEIGARLILYNDSEYPKLLKEIDYPPVILYALGKKIPEDQFFISIVGSRNATPYGIRIAKQFSYTLANLGIGIVSGMARGIDTYAHIGAIKGRGYTVAVLGSGLDVIYPKENKKLFQNIIENGTILSEFPLGTPPEAKNFPIRNRIISGMSKGVLVVEATRRSGSLITASFALNQGREVFAVPGSIESANSKGTHYLIKQGAKLVEDIFDILEEFGIQQKSKELKEDIKVKLSSQEKKIYECLSESPVHIDEIIRNTQMEASEVLSTLLKLEIKGIIKQIPGKLFLRA